MPPNRTTIHFLTVALPYPARQQLRTPARQSRNRRQAIASRLWPALWYRYNWGYRGYGAIQTNTVLYSKFNRVNVNTGGGQFQSWKFDAAHRANVPFKNTNLQHQFGSMNTKGVQGQTGTGLQGTQIGKGIQATPTGKGGVQGLQGIQTNKGTEGSKTSKAIEGVQSGKKSMHGVQTGSRVQEGGT